MSERQDTLRAVFSELAEMLPQVDYRDAGQTGLVAALLREAAGEVRTLTEGSFRAEMERVLSELSDAVSFLAGQEASSGQDRTEAVALCQTLAEKMAVVCAPAADRKRVIVFLPYKASMWDCLAGIWRAAQDDSAHTETYVIPLPYCDLTPDGSARQWYVERFLFPKEVPVSDYQEFPIEKLRAMHPDAILVHNPYDGNNYVTSVAAQYYTDKLKECTDDLVYIPYGVEGPSLNPDDCRMPGVLHADHVIVESETIWQQYVDNYPGDPPEGKFVALGSPKYDMVVKGRKEDFPLPEAWHQLAEGKKIILYNTTLVIMIQRPRDVIGKLCRILAVFEAHPEVVLWWRPHPLLRSTLEAMHPEYCEAYAAIEDRYRAAGWGIFDDTAELDRAILWSDAYYGDESSVVYLYQATGKPVLLAQYGSPSEDPAASLPRPPAGENLPMREAAFPLESFLASDRIGNRIAVHSQDGHAGERIYRFLCQTMAARQEGRA